MRKTGLSLFLLLILVVTLFPFTRVNADIESLWCSGYTSNRLGWATTGSSPYLDDTDGSYIYTKTDGQTEGDFSFSDLSSAGTITSVTLYLETYANDAPNDDGFDIWVYDGGSWTNEGTIQPSTTGWGNYETISLTTKLDTDTKVNAAQVYFAYSKSKGADDAYIRRAYLYVDYTPSSAEQYYRYPTQAIFWSGSNSRDWTLSRSFSQDVTFSGDTSRTWSSSRTSTQAFTFISNGERTLGAIRMVSQSLTATINANRIFTAIRTASQSLNAAFTGNRAWTAILKVSQSFTASGSAGRTWDLVRSASQTLTFTANALADLFTLIQRTVSLTLNMVSNSDRGWILKRVLSQELTFVSNGERLFDAIRVLSQSLTTTLNGNRIFSAVRDVSQSISATINTNRLFTAVRTASQSLTATISAGRTWDLKRILSQSMTFVSNIQVELVKGFTYFHRYVNIGLNLVLDGSRIWDISRSVSQTITFTSNALGDLLEFFSRTVSLTINFVSNGLGNITGLIQWLLSLVVTDFDEIPLENATVALTRNNSEITSYWKTWFNGSIPDQLLNSDDYFLEISKYEYLTSGIPLLMDGNVSLSIPLEGKIEEGALVINSLTVPISLTALAFTILLYYPKITKKKSEPNPIIAIVATIAWLISAMMTLHNDPDTWPIALFYGGLSVACVFDIIQGAFFMNEEEDDWDLRG